MTAVHLAGHAVARPGPSVPSLSDGLGGFRLILHVLAATVWVGGQFTVAGLLPTVRSLGEEAPKAVGRALGRLLWPAYAVLVVTGFWNIGALTVKDASSAWKTVLIVKIAVVVVAGVAVFLHQRATTPAGHRRLGGRRGPGLGGRPVPRRVPGRLSRASGTGPAPNTGGAAVGAAAQRARPDRSNLVEQQPTEGDTTVHFGPPAEIFGVDGIIILVVVVLVLFGSTQIPKLARSLGSAQKEFKKGLDEGSAEDDGTEPAVDPGHPAGGREPAAGPGPPAVHVERRRAPGSALLIAAGTGPMSEGPATAGRPAAGPSPAGVAGSRSGSSRPTELVVAVRLRRHLRPCRPTAACWSAAAGRLRRCWPSPPRVRSGSVRICGPRLHLTLVIAVAAVVAAGPVVPALRPDIEGIIVLEFGAVGLIRLATLTRMRSVRPSPASATAPAIAPVIDATAAVDRGDRPRPHARPGRGPPPGSSTAGRRPDRRAGRAAQPSASGRRAAAKHRPGGRGAGAAGHPGGGAARPGGSPPPRTGRTPPPADPAARRRRRPAPTETRAGGRCPRPTTSWRWPTGSGAARSTTAEIHPLRPIGRHGRGGRRGGASSPASPTSRPSAPTTGWCWWTPGAPSWPPTSTATLRAWSPGTAQHRRLLPRPHRPRLRRAGVGGGVGRGRAGPIRWWWPTRPCRPASTATS